MLVTKLKHSKIITFAILKKFCAHLLWSISFSKIYALIYSNGVQHLD